MSRDVDLLHEGAGFLDFIRRDNDKLAIVLGHEVSHVLARHGVERMGTSLLLMTAVTMFLVFLRYSRANAKAKRCAATMLSCPGTFSLLLCSSPHEGGELTVFPNLCIQTEMRELSCLCFPSMYAVGSKLKRSSCSCKQHRKGIPGLHVTVISGRGTNS